MIKHRNNLRKFESVKSRRELEDNVDYCIKDLSYTVDELKRVSNNMLEFLHSKEIRAIQHKGIYDWEEKGQKSCDSMIKTLEYLKETLADILETSLI